MGINQNRKWLIICMAVLCAVSLSASIFLLIVKLDEPVFLKNYCEYMWVSSEENPSGFMEQRFSIKYLSNPSDTRVVTSIDFPDADDSRFSFYATEMVMNQQFGTDFLLSDQNVQTPMVEHIGQYALHTVEIIAQYIHEREEKNHPELVLENAVAHFSDGSSQEISLGEIRLCHGDWSSHNNWLSETFAMSDTSGVTKSELQSNKTMSVVGLKWSPKVESEGLFKITLNGVDATSDEIIGMPIEEGQIFTVRTDFPEPEELEDRFTEYRINVLLTVQDDEGLQREIEVSFFSHRPIFEGTWDILRYVKQ